MARNVLIASVFAFIGLLGGTALAKNANGVACKNHGDCASNRCIFDVCKAP